MIENQKLKSIAVFCGSLSGNKTEYTQAAKDLAKAMSATKITLVYGGGRTGIMGVIADEMLAQGGQVIGIMPKFLVDREIAHTGITKLYSVDSMHERKTKIHELSDGFIMLPGALGTLEEFFETMTWATLGFHKKPCGILNTDGFFDFILKFLNETTNAGFMKPIYRDMILVDHQAKTLLQKFYAYKAPAEVKWVQNKTHTNYP